MRWSAGFLIVRVQPGGWRRDLVVPFPLFVFEEALEAVAALVRLGLWLGWHPPRPLRDVLTRERMSRLAELPLMFVRELRAHGPLVLAEVEDGPTRLSVRVV